MKKVININLGGRAFVINEDAFSELERYLNSIEKYFAGSEGKDDILYDIEIRIAELFVEDEKSGTIITREKVDKIRSIMGKPSDFGEATYADEQEYSAEPGIKTGKRLFRDPDDQVIAGVASGLSTYFGINDPIFIRILFVILFFGGLGPIPYIIFWIAVPKAKTASDRLAMQGKPININNIAVKVEESLNTIKDKIEDLGRDLKTKSFL